MGEREVPGLVTCLLCRKPAMYDADIGGGERGCGACGAVAMPEVWARIAELLAEASELSMLRDVEAGHVEEIAGLRERVRTLEMRLMASRTCRKQAEDGAEGIAMHALSKSLEIGLLTGERDALRNEVAALKTDLRDMTDRYHEASNEADVLRDRIEHAGAYGRIREMVREHHRAKREEAPQACFERPGGCSCWKAGE